jgi:hypothetical protein
MKRPSSSEDVTTTQRCFPGDPYLKESLLMALTGAPDGGKSAVLDFVLAVT